MMKRKKKKSTRRRTGQTIHKHGAHRSRMPDPAAAKNQARYTLNKDFGYFNELRSLLLKPSPEEKEWMVKQLSRLGRIKLAIISGIFLTHEAPDTYNSVADLFVVGDDINKKRVRAFLRLLEAEVGGEIQFSVMDKDEFDYRFNMFDRFIRVLLEGPHEKIINKLGL